MTTTLTHSTRSQPVQANTDASSDSAGTASTMPGSTGQARQYHACLVMHDGNRFCALTDEGTMWVSTAAGCLLQPAVGDVVLVSVAGASGYILSVLERGRPDQAAVLSVQGALQVKADAIDIAADQSLALNAGPSLTITGAVARVRLETAQVDVNVAQVHMGTAQLNCQTLGIEGAALHTRWAQRFDMSQERITIASRSETHLGYSTRRIAGHEEITAASFRQSVTRDWSVQAGTAALVGNDRTVIDGNSVQIG